MITDARLQWLSGPDYIRSEPGQVAAELLATRAALRDLHRQVSRFCEEEGEWEFYTGNAMAALGLSDNLVHLKTLADLLTSSGKAKHE